MFLAAAALAQIAPGPALSAAGCLNTDSSALLSPSFERAATKLNGAYSDGTDQRHPEDSRRCGRVEVVAWADGGGGGRARGGCAARVRGREPIAQAAAGARRGRAAAAGGRRTRRATDGDSSTSVVCGVVSALFKEDRIRADSDIVNISRVELSSKEVSTNSREAAAVSPGINASVLKSQRTDARENSAIIHITHRRATASN